MRTDHEAALIHAEDCFHDLLDLAHGPGDDRDLARAAKTRLWRFGRQHGDCLGELHELVAAALGEAERQRRRFRDDYDATARTILVLKMAKRSIADWEGPFRRVGQPLHSGALGAL